MTFFVLIFPNWGIFRNDKGTYMTQKSFYKLKQDAKVVSTGLFLSSPDNYLIFKLNVTVCDDFSLEQLKMRYIRFNLERTLFCINRSILVLNSNELLTI